MNGHKAVVVTSLLLLVTWRAAEAADVNWIDGDTPPAAWSILPSAPTTSDIITFSGPTRVYSNECYGAVSLGVPQVSVSMASKVVTLWFRALPPGTACIDLWMPVCGLQGEFGPLPAGDWTFVCLSQDLFFEVHFVVTSTVIQRTLTTSATAGGTVTAPGVGSFLYNDGTQVMVEATPHPLFEFAGWRGSTFSSANRLILTMHSDQEIRAHFVSLLDGLYVDDDAPSDPGPDDPNLSDPSENGTSAHPFDAIQEAIDVAKKHAKVIVRAGTYRETIDLLGKPITVSGLNDDPNDPNIADLPIIDAQGRTVVVKCTQGEDPNCILQGLVITGGKAQPAGGILCVGSSPTVRNCLIVGNRATGLNAGGGIHCEDSNAVFVNCTISGNCGGIAAAGVCFSQSNAVLSNSIVWENVPTQIRLVSSGDSVVAYTYVAGGWPGTANLGMDPRFARPGYWADPAGLTKVVSAMDPAAVWVGGDYHLLSQAGRWDPAAKTWVKDATTSPCVDAGDLNTPTGKEPPPNGGRVNLGVYGGTSQASMSSRGG